MSATNEHLVTMANQIARFFSHRPEDVAVAQIAEHLQLFWEPRMRRAFDAIIQAHDPALHPLAQKAGQVLINKNVQSNNSDSLSDSQPRAASAENPYEDPNTPPGGFKTHEQHNPGGAAT